MRRRLDGALLLDKPLGLSSNAALQEAKRLFAAQKAGHAGTLDPLASGLLLVLFGEATKFAGSLLEADKAYDATLRLGVTTTTADSEGEIQEVRPVEVSNAEIQSVLERFRGPIVQCPPMYSALKRDGMPLYRLARRGETVEREPRSVHIFTLDLLGRREELVEIRVRCSKGTYVRTLAEDIGHALGTGAHLAALRRTGLGRFSVGQALGLEALQALDHHERDCRVLPLAALLEDLPSVHIDAASEARLRNGQPLHISGLPHGRYAVFGPGHGVVGLGEMASGQLRPLRLTAPAQTADKAEQTL